MISISGTAISASKEDEQSQKLSQCGSGGGYVGQGGGAEGFGWRAKGKGRRAKGTGQCAKGQSFDAPDEGAFGHFHAVDAGCQPPCEIPVVPAVRRP